MSGVELYVALACFGVFTGVAAGLLGIGGGIMMVPFLVIVAGLSQHEAEATSLLVALPTAIVASVSLRRKGIGDLGFGLRLGVLGAAGGALGALIALALPGSVLKVLFAVFLAIIGVRLVRDSLVRPSGDAG